MAVLLKSLKIWIVKMIVDYVKKHFYMHRLAFIHFVICYLQYFSPKMLHESLVGMNWDFQHLCLSTKTSIAKCFKFRHPQKLFPQKTFKFRPLSAKISSYKINAASINSFRILNQSSFIYPFLYLRISKFYLRLLVLYFWGKSSLDCLLFFLSC